MNYPLSIMLVHNHEKAFGEFEKAARKYYAFRGYSQTHDPGKASAVVHITENNANTMCGIIMGNASPVRAGILRANQFALMIGRQVLYLRCSNQNQITCAVCDGKRKSILQCCLWGILIW